MIARVPAAGSILVFLGFLDLFGPISVGQHEGPHVARAGVDERAGTCSESRAGGADVVDQEDAAALDVTRRWTAKRGLDVGGSSGAIERGLRRRLTDADESTRRVREPETTRDGRPEERSLIETTLDETLRMERHRDDEIGAGASIRQRGRRFRHHVGEARREVRASGILEADDRGRDGSAVIEDGVMPARELRSTKHRRRARTTEEEAWPDGGLTRSAARGRDDLGDEVDDDGGEARESAVGRGHP